MEWILGIVVAVMLVLLFYAAYQVSKKYEPAVDAVFDGIHTIVDATSRRPKSESPSDIPKPD